MSGRNDPCWCGSGKKWKKCHAPVQGAVKSGQDLTNYYFKNYRIRLKSEEEIRGMRRAGRLAKAVLNKVCKEASAGVTTNQLNDLADRLFKEAGAVSATLHYGNPPYPKSICISLNEVVCHGIADERLLVEGDILNIDVSCLFEGFYGDCSAMVVIGKTSQERQLVVDVAYECLMKSIEILRPGLPLYEIGNTIHAHATAKGCSVVHQFVAHGIGRKFHEPPQIPHCLNKIDIPLAAGMTFTIEPMINAGVAECRIDEEDKWTAYTEDGRASAQWEHTLLITPTGYEILTADEG